MATSARGVLSAVKAAKAPSPATVGSGYGVAGGSYGSGLSPLVAGYAMPGMPYGYRGYGDALPRDPAAFLSGMFSPLAPIQPVGVDQPSPGFDRPEPRRFEYPVAWNMPIGVPGSEGLKLASFANLRSIADIYSVARACIKLRIQEMLGLEWDIIPTKDAEKNMRGSDSKHKDFQQRRAQAMKFFRNPDPEYGSFEAWMSALLEEVLVVDALSLYLHPTRMKGKGLLGSNLASLELISGDTVRPLLDVHGGRPKPPNTAYQQYLYGVPRTDLMTVINGDDLRENEDIAERLVREYRGDQLLYLPYFRRAWTPYGFPPLEQALIPAMMGIQRQNWQLDTYSEGTVPAVFISAGDMNASPNQLRELQDALNAMAGDPAWKHKIIVLPGNSKIDPMKPQALADAFDEIMMTQMAMAYDVMPTELGINPKVSAQPSPAAGKAVTSAAERVNQRKALRPMLKWLKANIFDYVLQRVCGEEDMQWMWEGLEEGVDEESQVSLLIQEISFGLKSIDEARVQRGEQPWGLGLTSDPVYATPNGLMPIGAIDPATGMPAGVQPEIAGASAQRLATQPQAPSGSTSQLPTASHPGPKPGAANGNGARGPKPKPKPMASAKPSGKPSASTARPAAAPRRTAGTGTPAGARVTPAHAARGAASKNEKLGKNEVAYRAANEPGRSCGTCSMFRADTNSCTLVEGYIMPGMVCDRWDLAERFEPVSTKAALSELDQIRRQLKKGRSVSDWQAKSIPDSVIGELLSDIRLMPEGDAIMKARDSVYKMARGWLAKAAQEREEAIGAASQHVVEGLRDLAARVESGKLATADFVHQASELMFHGVREGLRAGAQAAIDQYRAERNTVRRYQGAQWEVIAKDDDGYEDILSPGSPYSDYLDSVAKDESDRQHGYLAGLLQDILAGLGIADWLDGMMGRFGLYGGAVGSAYEQGYGLTYAAVNAPGSVVYTWYTTSSKPCKLCGPRDGREFTEDQLPGFPGQGGFQGIVAGSEVAICMGGPNCQCYLVAKSVPDATGTPGGLFAAARRALGFFLGKAQATEITQHGTVQHKPDETHHVYAYLARHYPAHALEWVKKAEWFGPEEVKLSKINMARRAGGARDPEKVQMIAHSIEDGVELEPVVLVRVPGEKKLQIADGWHRTLAVKHTGRKAALAYIGNIPEADDFSAEEMGASKLNH